MSAPFIGVIDIPLNPEIVSLATLGIPAHICLESISIPSNGISYISELEFTFLLDGEQIWQGRGKSGGIEFGIPEEFAFSETGRSLLILVSPSLMLSLPSMELSTTELPIAIRGHEGDCAITIEIEDDLHEFDYDFKIEWV